VYLTIATQSRLIHGGSGGGSGEKTGGVFWGYCRDDCDSCRGGRHGDGRHGDKSSASVGAFL
jgi:hypothetical protein